MPAAKLAAISAIGSARFRDIMDHSRSVRKGEKLEVGKRYWNQYWQYVYEVVAINGTRITITTPVNGETWSHSTPLDKKDRVMTDA